MTREIEIGEEYTGTVTRLMNFGAFVEILPGKEGLIRISDLAWEYVPSVEEVLSVGDEVKVVVNEIDDQNRVNLSRKALLPKPEGYQERERAPRGEGPGGQREGGENRGPRPEGGDRGPREGGGDRGGNRGPRREGGGGFNRGPRREGGGNQGGGNPGGGNSGGPRGGMGGFGGPRQQ